MDNFAFHGKRQDWPDVAKGICIISIILGHLGAAEINRIVYLYHIPVFFLIAGYFLKKTEEKQFIKKKARRLLVPYAVTSMIICFLAAIKAVISGASIKGVLFPWIGAALYGAGDDWQKPFVIKGIGAIWFLWALFFGLIIVNHFVERSYYQAVIAVIAFFGWMSFDRTGIWLPLSVQSGMLSSLYILIGYECRKRKRSVKDISIPIFLLMLLIMLFGIWNFHGFWLVHNYFGNGWFDFFMSLAASGVVLKLSQILCKTGWLKKILVFFGQNSMLVLCAHLIELKMLPFRDLINIIAGDSISKPVLALLLLIAVKLIYVVAVVKCFKLVTNYCLPAS